MIDESKDGLSQIMISILSDMSPTSVSRMINTNKFIPIQHDDFNKNHKSIRYAVKEVRNIISMLNRINSVKVLKKVFAFYNFKGGTGKTSICFQVSSHVALMGFKVLVIDADPQSHLSTTYGFNSENNNFTLYDMLINKVGFDDVRKRVYEGLDIIPSNLSLTRIEVELNRLPKREEILSIEFENIIDEYDFIFIDTNPTISILNRNVITFSDVISIICETQPYSLNGLRLLMDDLNSFYSHMRIKDKEVIIVPNKYEDRTVSSAESMTALREFYSEYVKKDFAIRKSEDINTAAKIGKPLSFFCKKNSIALNDILELINYILNKFTKR